MNAWSILAIVLSIGVIALVGFLIPILIQVKDLLKLAETTVLRIEKDVEPVIQNVEGITHNFEGITGVANDFMNRKPKEKTISNNELSMLNSVKKTVVESVKVVKEEYIPEAKFTAGKYFTATKIGYKVAINSFKNKPVNSDFQLVKYDQRNELVKIDDNETNEVVIFDTITVK